VKINSEVGVYNLALNAVGDRSNLSSPTDNSRQAEVCSLWYALVRDQVIEAAPWSEATKYQRLALVAEQDDDTWTAGEPAPGYTHVYALPSDCLRPQYLSNFQSFELTTEGTVKLLHCSTDSPVLRYTYMQENVATWSNNLLMAIVYGLAGHISQPLSGKTSQTAVLIQRANDMILAARVNSANQEQQTYEAVPEWISGRGYAQGATQQFYFPMGSLLYVS